MSITVWVLSFTVIGTEPEHKTFAKYNTKEECQQILVSTKQEYKEKGKKISGVCTPMLKEKSDR